MPARLASKYLIFGHLTALTSPVDNYVDKAAGAGRLPGRIWGRTIGRSRAVGRNFNIFKDLNDILQPAVPGLAGKPRQHLLDAIL
jgi:hypothetical protein